MLKLKVRDVSCGHCASTVRKAVESVDPTAVVTVDLASGTATVETTAAPEAVRSAIGGAGYPNELAA